MTVLRRILYIFSSDEKYHREVHIIVVDFSDGQKVYPRIAAELKDRDIGILGQ